jgi:anthranilate synthase component 1
VYAGAVGWFGYDVVRADGLNKVILVEGPIDTCIAIRTMLVQHGVAYLQAGGGIVYDSDPTEEWLETMNKLAANLRCIELAEKIYQGKAGAKPVEDIIREQGGL